MDRILVIGTVALFVAIGAVKDQANASGSSDALKTQRVRSAAIQPRSRYDNDCSRGRGVDHPWACTGLSPAMTGDYSDYY